MQVQVIEIKNLIKSDEIDIKDLIYYFMRSLKDNGQILSGSLMVQNDDNYMLYVTTPKSDSLNKRFDSIYVQRNRDQLNQFCTISTKYIGTNVDSQEYCSCSKRTIIEMETYANDIDSVFTCCTCGKPIALYELPYFGEHDHWYIVNWQNTYRSVVTLWLDGLSDRFTGNQLVNVNSALNKYGREISDEIGHKVGAKIYYNIFDDLTKKVRFEKINGKYIRLCPGCQKAMKYIKFGDDYERFVCDDCSLSSRLPKED